MEALNDFDGTTMTVDEDEVETIKEELYTDLEEDQIDNMPLKSDSLHSSDLFQSPPPLSPDCSAETPNMMDSQNLDDPQLTQEM